MLRMEPMREAHREAVMEMMRVFYASEAVLTDGSEAIFRADVEACLGPSPFLEGFVLLDGETLAGYTMLAHSFSTEFGRPCVWVEDLYLLPEYREQGEGSRLLRELTGRYPGAVVRLEAEKENHRALHVYEKCGFQQLPYRELIHGVTLR